LSVTSMVSMFYDATLFNQNLCAWSNMLNYYVSASNIFDLTSCPFSTKPFVVRIPPIHICQSCS